MTRILYLPSIGNEAVCGKLGDVVYGRSAIYCAIVMMLKISSRNKLRSYKTAFNPKN